MLLPVAVATIGLIALGAVQALSAVRLAGDSSQAAAMADTATATVRLTQQLETEIAEEDALRQRGGSAGANLATAARGQTDLAVAAFQQTSQTARQAAPGLRPLLDAAAAQVGMLPNIRARAERLDADQLSAPTYEDLNRSLLGIADAIPELLTDVTLAANARAAAAIAAAEHLAAQERDLLRGVFLRGTYLPGELASLALLAGAENERLAEFNRYATPGERDRYAALITGDDVNTASRIVSGALAADRQQDALKVDPDTWYIAQSNTLRRLHLLEVELSRELDQTARTDKASAQARAVVTGLSTAGLVLLAFTTALVLAIRTSRRLRALRGAALVVAGVELPDTISSLTSAGDAESVQSAMRSAATRAGSLVVEGSDEISEVGTALAAVHRQALYLAAEQASMRLDVSALFAALSRRGQTLIQRQLRLLDEFERSETDPQVLARLFALDHLAARMRRNEENLLVLAGGEPGRRVLAPVSLIDVVRAAAAEIEDYERVEATGLVDVGVVAHAVRDIIHLLAELLENATMYSPPTSKVRVTARRSIDSLSISVFDEGIGVSARTAAELNARLARPSMLTSELAGTMGLLVVGRLAERHGIHVELRSSAPGGTVALVTLPGSLLTAAPAVTGHTNSLLYPEPEAIGAPRETYTYPTSGPRRLPAAPSPTSPRPGPDAVPPAWPVPSVPPPAVASVPPPDAAASPAPAPPASAFAPPAAVDPHVAAGGTQLAGPASPPGTAVPLPRVPQDAPPAAAPAPPAGPADSGGITVSPGTGLPGGATDDAASTARQHGGAATPGAAGSPGAVPLPRRRPGDLLMPTAATGPGERNTAGPPKQPSGGALDPDAVRARLSGLARGLAAGDRRVRGTEPPATGTEPNRTENDEPRP